VTATEKTTFNWFATSTRPYMCEGDPEQTLGGGAAGGASGAGSNRLHQTPKGKTLPVLTLRCDHHPLNEKVLAALMLPGPFTTCPILVDHQAAAPTYDESRRPSRGTAGPIGIEATL
jgi:hypothetical protein